MKKKIFFLSIIIILIVLVFFIATSILNNPTNNNENDTSIGNNNTGTYQDYLNNMTSGGPPKDGIPPIDTPKYINIENANVFLEDFNKVFVYESDEGVFIYPQRILVWHEIVNDIIDGERISVTYCPLTGSTVVYLSEIVDGNENTFGTSGQLLNSNLVMYDRATDSYFPQILGIAIFGQFEGKELSTRPIHWANWEDAKTLFPDAKVLSTETGFLRDYDSDPYGSYADGDEKSYYFAPGTLFPLMNDNDGTFRDKKVVVGIKANNKQLALNPFTVRDAGIMHFDIGETNAIAFYDFDLKTVRIFDSRLNSELINFEYKNELIVDSAGMQWSSKGIAENGDKLTPLNYFDVMWFAWHAFYPDTEVIK